MKAYLVLPSHTIVKMSIEGMRRMNKGIKQVRKSIEQRKKNQRVLKTRELQTKKASPVFPQEEEKHGYYPVLPDSTTGQSAGTGRNKLGSGMLVKGIVSCLLFFGAGLLYQTDYEEVNKPAQWTTSALTKEFPFAKVNGWYQQTFGEPLGFSSEETVNGSDRQADQSLALPVNGSVEESFQANGSGITIAPKQATDVSVLREGVVLFAGNDRKTNKTVTVQHKDGSISTYGHLDSLDVHVYQHVEAHQRLGEFVPDDTNKNVFFSVEKDNEYIDPVQVIKVDDAS